MCLSALLLCLFRSSAAAALTTDQFPYQASLHADGNFLCSGALIAPKWVLTSASCILGNPRIARVGSSDFTAGGQVSPIVYVRTHPAYEPARLFANDVALVALANSIYFDSRAKAIKLADREPSAGMQLYAIGWGGHAKSPKYPRRLLSALRAAVVERSRCNATVHQLARHFITEDVVCTGGDGRGFCHDNLGAVLAARNGVLYGIATWTQTCGKTLNHDLFVSVVYHRAFIRRTLQIDN